MSCAVVLRALRADARRWWYHAELRERGQLAEARKLEAKSIRSGVKHLRDARAAGGWLFLGRGGETLHIGAGHRLEGLHAGIREACQHLLPWVDTRTVPDDRLGQLISLPMAKVGCTERERFDQYAGLATVLAGGSGFEGAAATAPAGGLDYVPPAEYARLAAELGATVGGWA